jgi:hypothetical protein
MREVPEDGDDAVFVEEFEEFFNLGDEEDGDGVEGDSLDGMDVDLDCARGVVVREAGEESRDDFFVLAVFFSEPGFEVVFLDAGGDDVDGDDDEWEYDEDEEVFKTEADAEGEKQCAEI